MMRSLLLLVLVSFSYSCLDVNAVYFDVNNCNTDTPCVFVSPVGNDTNDGTLSLPFQTIPKALNSLKTATIPTTIVLADGVYSGGITWSGRNLSLTSINGPATTIIDCYRLPNVRGLWIGSGESSLTVISGITIQNCRTQMAAGMAIVGANTKPIIKDVYLLNNQATNGGGALLFFSSPTLINVTISGSTANQGAALFITHNATQIIAPQLQAMSLALGYTPTPPLPTGATAYVNMSYMTFVGNAAVSPGGAYFLMSAYRVRCDQCLFSGNSGSGSGAIAAGAGSTFVVSNSIFTGNQAQSAHGGAISVQQTSTGIIRNCSFIGNTAALNGGAICIGGVGLPSSLNIINSTFDSNQASQGSIVYLDTASHANITDCTTRNNIASLLGGILLLNPESAARYNITSNTYENNVALGNYGADYGSYASKLVFIEPNNSTQIGFSGTTPSIYPVNTSSSLSRTIYNLDAIVLKILLLDTFGQRLDLNESNTTGVFPGIYSDVTTLDNMTVPALLVQSTRVKMPTGVSDVQVILVGEITKTYAVVFSTDLPNVAPIRLLVSIQACAPFSYTTYYDNTNFPICHSAREHKLSDALFNAILVLSVILMACVIIVQGLTIWYWNTPVFKGSTPLFMSLMLFGAIIGYLATILSVLDVNRTTMFDTICKSQYWMMGIAFVLMFATLALKTWRIRNIFCNETLTEIKAVSTWGLLQWLLLVLALEMIIHILWISIDPLHSSLQVVNGQLATVCASSNDNIFLIVNLVYKGLIAIVCVIFAYQTRDVASRFNESRQLMIASYNMFVCVIVIAALSLALPDPDARRTVYAVGALFVITSTWFVLFVPKLHLAMFKREKNVSIASPTGSGGKNSNSGGKTSNSNGKISHSDHHKSTDKYITKSSLNHQMSTGNIAQCATPHSHTRSKAGSVASTAPGSPAVAPRLALNLNQRSSMSHVMGPQSVASPVGGGSPHIQALAMTVPRQLSTLNLSSRTPQIQEDGTPVPITPDQVVMEVEPEVVTPFQQSRRTSQPTLFADAGYTMLEMNTLNTNNNNTANNTNNNSPQFHSVRSIPAAKNFI